MKINLLLTVITLLIATLAVRAQEGPPPPESSDDLAFRMAERRARLLQPEADAPAIPLLLPPPASAPAPAPALFTESAWQALFARLVSDQFSVREAAQKQLDQFTWRTLPELKTRAAAVSDPEAAARLAARVTAIEDLMAYDPPPISLDLKDATFDELVAALQNATGQQFGRPIGNVIGPESFTLSAREMPFWEVYRDLNRQHPVTVRALSGAFILSNGPSANVLHRIHGGLATFTAPITLTPLAAPRAGTIANLPAYIFQYTLALDPRIKPAKYQRPRLLHVVDDAGNVLYHAPPAENVAMTNYSAFHIISAGTTFPIPQKPGKTIASATGEFHLLIQLAATTVEIAQTDKKLNQPIAIGNEKITIAQFDDFANSVRLQIDRMVTRGQREPSPLALTLLDAANRPLYNSILEGPVNLRIAANNAPGPYKLKLSIPTKTREVTIPFELKDLPLPGN